MIPAAINPEYTSLKAQDSRLELFEKGQERKIKDLRAKISEGQRAVDPDALMEMVLSDKDIQTPEDVHTQLTSEILKWEAARDARQSLKPKLAKAKYDAGTAILKSAEVQKTHGELMQRIVQPLAEVARAWVELFGMSRELRDRQIGFRHSICETMPLDLFGPPNASSPLASFLQAAVAAGYLKAGALPKEFKNG